MDTTPVPTNNERPPIDIDALPWYKSPWLWGAIIGIVSVTALRPCTQHIPDPLPVLGAAPTWMRAAAPTDTPVSVVAIYDTDCVPCVQAIEGLAEVSRRSSWAKTPASFRVLVPTGTQTSDIQTHFAYEERWSIVEFDRTEDWAEGILAAHVETAADDAEKWTKFIHNGPIWIIDQQGGIRGPLSTQDERGRSEVFHRTQRVLRELSDAVPAPR